MTYRVLPSANPLYQTVTTNGRTYTAAPGQVLDVPEADGLILAGNGWALVSLSGSTSARPTGRGGPATNLRQPGTTFYDTTIGALIVFDGASWRDPSTGNAV